MSQKIMKTLDGNEAAARIAYKVTDVSAIYPITPSSPMGELADEWSSKGQTNLWGVVPQVVELQSEGGASGSLHGALQSGALATTYTASQGLLLMIPNMYKIAGELTPCVIHVSARSLAAQALSIFGDHADVMACRQTGFAMLCSASVQEAQDMSMVAHAATLESRVPFLHFFEGFRTSHELNKIELLDDEMIRQMIDDELVKAHRRRALSPDHPVVRGTAQNPDVYFQGRETVNPFYELVPGIVQKAMDQLGKLTGRQYDLMSYYGSDQADRVIVIMGSGVQPVKEIVDFLNKKGEKVGVIQIRLYRPFPKAEFVKALPATVKSIAVLDRTKEPGSAGEPIYQDVMTALYEFGIFKTVVNGRYGLSSKEFTPAMVKSVYDELAKTKPKNHFTVGIHDDVTHTSLDFDAHFVTELDDVIRAIFYGLGADGTVGANKNTIKIIGENTDNYCQGYFVYDSKKSGARTVSHLRFGPKPINAPYLIQSANFVGVHLFNFIEKTDVLKTIAKEGVFLLNSHYGIEEVWHHLPKNVQQIIIERKIKFYVIDAYKVAKETGMGSRINTIMQTCFFALANVIPKEVAIIKIKEAIKKTYSSKGEEIVKKNDAAVDAALAHLHEVKVPANVDQDAKEMPKAVSDKAPAFVKDVLAKIMTDEGDDLPVSAFPIDGTYPCGTTKWEKRNVSQDVAHWDEKTCIQCGRCSLVCPHGVIRVKRYDEKLLANAPAGFQSSNVKGKAGLKHTLQVYLEDCTGCDLCHVTCPVKNKENAALKAINLVNKDPILESERKNIDFFETLPWVDRVSMEPNSIPEVQLLEPYFEFSGSCAGCGETPYVKLVSQLFGDRMLVANATGCSSIYGGNLPTTPWACDATGHGPAWSNSLFEDNAEFGYGFRVAEDTLREEAKILLQKMASQLDEKLISEIIDHMSDHSDALIQAQRKRVAALKENLSQINSNESSYLLSLADHFVYRSIWIFGGDGWAYDIGYGGLDHVLAQGRKVNVMVLDTEVYSNTGGQASKATPIGAIAKFAAGGKHSGKKDLGMMAINYGNVYVAQIALGSNPAQALKAIREAESYPGASLIIAYSHCIAHGYNLELGLNQQDLAVKSGHWPLYRYNPMLIAEGKNPFQLDSKAPSIPLKDYIYNESRFKSLLTTHPEEAAKLLKEAQEFVDHKWKKYEKLSLGS